MRTYLEFRKQRRKEGQKTDRVKVIHVFGKVETIGMIRWHGAWRQYVLDPTEDTFWSKGCLEAVANILDKMNRKQRAGWKKRTKFTGRGDAI